MTSFDVTTTKNVGWKALPLDPDLYWLVDSEKEFFKAQTGIQSDEELKDHVLHAQRMAYTVAPYPSIRVFSFLRQKITLRDTYPRALALGKERPSGIFLEVGAGFGSDARKLVSDGYPVENVVATDLHEGLWNAGHELFKSTQESFPVTFIPGDIFRLTEGLERATPSDRPDLPTIRSLVPLRAHVSILYATHFFHLFDEQRSGELANRLALLLSPEKGSYMFGLQLGAPEAALQKSPAGTMFCHSPDSWKEMWREVFAPEAVKIEAELVDPEAESWLLDPENESRLVKAYAGSDKAAPKILLLMWSVERS